MSAPHSNLRGIGLMVLATGVFVTNDMLMKVATEDLPPFEVIVLRGVAAMLWCLPLLAVSGTLSRAGRALRPMVMLRNLFELVAVLCFIVALANMPIADVTALGQVAPALLLVGVAVFYRERVRPVTMALIGLSLIGALLVARPGAEGLSPYAILGLLAAAGTAARDIVGRRIGIDIPGPVVAFGAVVVVTIGAAIAMLATETMVMPQPRHLLLLAGSGLFLTIGHLCIFLAYRAGATASVAPFYYMFTVWAVIYGVVVFGTLPDAVAMIGIGLILGSGIAIVLLDERRRRLMITA